MVFRLKFLQEVLNNWFSCLRGDKTWVSYHQPADSSNLPPLSQGVFCIGQNISPDMKDDQLISNLNFIYAANYQWQNDLNYIVKAFFSNNFATLKLK